MPITSHRMMNLAQAAERLIEGRKDIQRLALFRPPELDQAAMVLSNPTCSVDDARAAAVQVIAMYDGLIDRITRQLVPEFEDMQTIAKEIEHFKVTHKHNTSARLSMQKLRNRRKADRGIMVPPARASAQVEAINAKYWPITAQDAPAPNLQAELSDDEMGDALGLGEPPPRPVAHQMQQPETSTATDDEIELDRKRRELERELRNADTSAPLIPRQR